MSTPTTNPSPPFLLAASWALFSTRFCAISIAFVLIFYLSCSPPCIASRSWSARRDLARPGRPKNCFCFSLRYSEEHHVDGPIGDAVATCWQTVLSTLPYFCHLFPDLWVMGGLGATGDQSVAPWASSRHPPSAIRHPIEGMVHVGEDNGGVGKQ